MSTADVAIADAQARPDPRRWTALAILLAGAFLPPLDFFIVNIALPAIRSDLRASPAALQGVMSGYAVAYAVLLILGGRLCGGVRAMRARLVGVGAGGGAARPGRGLGGAGAPGAGLDPSPVSRAGKAQSAGLLRLHDRLGLDRGADSGGSLD